MKFCFRINHSCYRNLSVLIILVLCAQGFPAQGEPKVWSERKFDRTILSIDKDIRRKRWEKVIEAANKRCLNVARCIQNRRQAAF
jgi:hypothetical protein